MLDPYKEELAAVSAQTYLSNEEKERLSTFGNIATQLLDTQTEAAAAIP